MAVAMAVALAVAVAVAVAVAMQDQLPALEFRRVDWLQYER
jgi:cbb3-type cytochrome oxidase subunit 1